MYSGIYINDILACRHNFDLYYHGFEGFKIVEVTYYKKVYRESALLFNYPCYDNRKKVHKLVRVNFEDSKECWKYYNDFKESNHKEPMILAGIWKKTNNPNCICECTFYHKNQLFLLSNV